MKRNLVAMLLVISLGNIFGCGGGEKNASQASIPEAVPVVSAQSHYSTSTSLIAINPVTASIGGVVTATTETSSLDNVKLSIPVGALGIDTIITVGAVDNPPALPVGLNFIGPVVDFGPDGTTFKKPVTIEIPFTDQDLDNAGIESKAALKLYAFDKATKNWSEAKITSIDTSKNIITGEVKHFSFYSLVGLSGMPPEDLGTPQPGDLLYKLTLDSESFLVGWVPGHEGVYTGEKNWNGEGKASKDVIRCGKYNVVESLLGSGVQYSYYKIPNTVQSCEVKSLFQGDSMYMGAREPKYFTLTAEQRMKIVEYAEKQVGKPYVNLKTAFGLLDGFLVKGPKAFNCVGLSEKSYEMSGAQDAQGLIVNDDYEILTPAKQYSRTKPAGGKVALPVIEWATLSPDSGTIKTQMLAEIKVSHEYGLDFIDSVRYMTDKGFIDPNILINDQGLYGDAKAGDGIFSAQGQVGGKQSDVTLGMTFIVTDKSGKSVSIHKEFRYVINVTIPVVYSKQVETKPVKQFVWGR